MTVFARDFDLEMIEEEARRDYERRASVTPEELQTAIAEARAEGYAAGLAEGHAAGRAQVEGEDRHRDTEALEALLPRLDTVYAEAAAHRAALERQTLDFAKCVCEQTFPELLRSQADRRAAARLRRGIALSLGSPRLTLRVAEASEPTLRPQIEAAVSGQGYAGQVAILADPQLAPGDARAEWDNGFLDYSLSEVCDQILEALRRSAASADPNSSRSDARG